jgi:hypothetical protein
MFEEPPGTCDPGTDRETPGSCGPCGAGASLEVCGSDGLWRPAGCRSDVDRDGDGVPNETCAAEHGACCGAAIDCNDDAEDVQPATYACYYREEESGGPEAEACTAECGTPGTRTCRADCTWGACRPPAEVCNGADDDCDTTCDNGRDCCAGRTEACLTTCGSAGTRTCSAACTWEAECAPPPETCDGADEDCDTEIDEDFECQPGELGTCTAGGCAGARSCSLDCLWSACLPGDWDPPGPPALLAPENGERTGSGTTVPGAARRPAFRWLPVDPGCGEPTYEVQVDDSCPPAGFAICDFPSPEALGEAIASAEPFASWTPDVDLPVAATPPVGRRYYWRVRSCDVFGRCGDWSGVRYVDVGRERDDFDGDGHADILVGAPESDAGATDAGRVFVFRGGPAVDTGADLELSGENAGDRFGHAVAGVGDVNGDGFADFLVGAPGFDADAAADAGLAVLYLGGASLPAGPALRYPGSAAFDRLGQAVAGAGDVDGDGYGDFVVGAPGDDTPALDAGRVELFAGGSEPDAVPARTWFGDVPSGGFGGAVAGAGDFNGDGFADVVVGAPNADAPAAADSGLAYVFYGARSPDTRPGVVFAGSGASERLGTAVAGVGDFDGDGFADVVVGAPRFRAMPAAAGRAYVYSGGRAPGTAPGRTLGGSAAGDLFGWSVAGAGDVDDDGQADVVVGAPSTGGAAGAAFLFLGSAAPAPTAALRVDGEADQTGFSVGRAGDVDGDGYADFVVGAPYHDGAGGANAGRAVLLLGSDPPSAAGAPSLEGGAAEDRFGAAVGGAP